MAFPDALLANPTKYFTAAAGRATARGDLSLAAAINSLPAAVLADPATYRALAEPVADAIATAEGVNLTVDKA